MLTIRKPGQHLVLLLLTLTYFAFYSTVNIAEFKQINAGWAWEMVVSGNKFVFSNCEIYIIVWVGKIFCTVCLYLHLYSCKIKLLRDTFSWQHFKKISSILQCFRRAEYQGFPVGDGKFCKQGIFLSGGWNLRRSVFDHLNLFQN